MKLPFAALLTACAALAQTPGAPIQTFSSETSYESAGGGTPASRTATVIRAGAPSNLTVKVNRSIILEHPAGIRRISITNPDIAEAVAVSSAELLINGKSAGGTSLILWDTKGTRTDFDVHVVPNDAKADVVRDELMKEVGPAVSLTVGEGSVFLRGTVNDAITADRAARIAGTLGKVVNLLRVVVPPEDPQILLKVRFADVDRSATTQIGVNLFSLNPKGFANSTTGQFGQNPSITPGNSAGSAATTSFSDLLNIFYFNPDLNIGAFIQALQAKSLLQILAEPNLLTISGRPASFLAGGEFPFPTIQGGAGGVGQITIQFKEFGIRLNFIPTVTPRGTIHLLVTPEVSSLDYSNGLTVNGFSVPGLSTRRVETEIELESGQSFVIAGLLNNQVTDQLNKVPGLGDIPVLGKLFQSRSLSKTNSELLVMVTPELVRPIPAGAKRPDIEMPAPFLKGAPMSAPANPGPAVTGAPRAIPTYPSLPVEQLQTTGQTPAPNSNTQPQLMVVQPVQLTPAQVPGTAPTTPPNPPTNPPGSNH